MKTTIKYKDLVRHTLRGYINGRKREIESSVPEYPAVLSHYLMNPIHEHVFGNENFKIEYVRTINEYSKYTGTNIPEEASQLKLVFSDVPFPPPKNPKFTFIDLFAGIGGIRMAFQNAGGKCVFSSEWDKYAQMTYFENFGEIPFGDIKRFTDIDNITDTDLNNLIPDHDVLCAGFPCQPFSLAGVSKKNSLGRKHGFKDPTQGTLFFDIKRIISVKRPKAFFLENVKHLTHHDKGKTFKVISDVLDDLKYTWDYSIIDASKWVPQSRKRIFLVGFDPKQLDLKKDDIQIPVGPGNRYNYPELASIINQEVDAKHTLGPGTWATLERHKNHHAKAGNGFGYGLLPVPVPPGHITRTISARYHKDGAEILVEQPGQRPRRLTVAEAQQLQGFPKGKFTFPVSDTQAYRQIGNSVAVPSVEATAKTICKMLESRGCVK